jgi:exopolyphosphatase / guanosine-5'-triphosphate,3'-diphosphate pyrophosphatase
MSDADLPAAPRPRAPSRRRDAYAAIDLGTNNCRLLIAEPHRHGFRVVDGYSQIVRLGEGLAASGALSEGAMARTLQALETCAQRLRQRRARFVRAIATQACRQASNGRTFLAEVERRTGLALEIIDHAEEARLAAAGCAALIDPQAQAALVVDIGGGSTELTWVNAAAAARDPLSAPILAWTTLPFGVVTLAEQAGPGIETEEGFTTAIAQIAAAIRAFRGADALAAVFAAGQGQLVGASGTVTSLAGVHLNLTRYNRALVDGHTLKVADARATMLRLRQAGHDGRAAMACVGPLRADLVVPGAAILEAVLQTWPARAIRVADRGLREGILLTLMAAEQRRARVRGDA